MSMIDAAAEAELVRAARAAQTAALARGDYDAVARHWTEDVTMRRALGHAVSGIAAARAALAPPAGGGAHIVYQRRAIQVEVSVRWPLAFEEGVWSGHPGSADAAPVIAGRYAAQWVKRDGAWLIRSEVFVALTCAGAGCDFDALP